VEQVNYSLAYPNLLGKKGYVVVAAAAQMAALKVAVRHTSRCKSTKFGHPDAIIS